MSHFGLLPHFLSLQAAHVRVPHWLNTAASWFLMTWLATTRAALETLPQGLHWSIRLRGLAVKHCQTWSNLSCQKTVAQLSLWRIRRAEIAGPDRRCPATRRAGPDSPYAIYSLTETLGQHGDGAHMIHMIHIIPRNRPPSPPRTPHTYDTTYPSYRDSDTMGSQCI